MGLPFHRTPFGEHWLWAVKLFFDSSKKCILHHTGLKQKSHEIIHNPYCFQYSLMFSVLFFKSSGHDSLHWFPDPLMGLKVWKILTQRLPLNGVGMTMKTDCHLFVFKTRIITEALKVLFLAALITKSGFYGFLFCLVLLLQTPHT